MNGVRITYDCDEPGGPTYVVFVPLESGVPFPKAFAAAADEATRLLTISLGRDLLNVGPTEVSLAPRC